jgi:hypothetical protein
MKTINCAKGICTKYCGRPGSIDRAMGKPEDFSVLGNPHIMLEDTERERAAVIALHRRDLWVALQEDTPIRRALLKLKDDDILGCFCAPKACHCDTLIAAYEWLKTQPCFTS